MGNLSCFFSHLFGNLDSPTKCDNHTNLCDYGTSIQFFLRS